MAKVHPAMWVKCYCTNSHCGEKLLIAEEELNHLLESGREFNSGANSGASESINGLTQPLPETSGQTCLKTLNCPACRGKLNLGVQRWRKARCSNPSCNASFLTEQSRTANSKARIAETLIVGPTMTRPVIAKKVTATVFRPRRIPFTVAGIAKLYKKNHRVAVITACIGFASLTVAAHFFEFRSVASLVSPRVWKNYLLGKSPNLSPQNSLSLHTNSRSAVSSISALDITHSTIRLIDLTRDPKAAQFYFKAWDDRCRKILDAGTPSKSLVDGLSAARTAIKSAVETLNLETSDSVELEENRNLVSDYLHDATLIADQVAQEDSINFSDAHGSSRFSESCLCFFSVAQRAHDLLRAMKLAKFTPEHLADLKQAKFQIMERLADIPPLGAGSPIEGHIDDEIKGVYSSLISAIEACESVGESATTGSTAGDSAIAHAYTKIFYTELRRNRYALERASLKLNHGRIDQNLKLFNRNSEILSAGIPSFSMGNGPKRDRPAEESAKGNR